MKKREAIFPIRILITTDAIHLAKLKELAKITNTSVSEVVRYLIDDFTAETDKEYDEINE